MRSVEIAKSLVIYLVAFALVWIGLSVPFIPPHWVALAIAVVSFGAAVYYAQRRAVQSTSSSKPTPWLFVLFGCIAIGLAVGIWISPPPAPTPAMWFGLVSGVLLGGVLLGVAQGRNSI